MIPEKFYILNHEIEIVYDSEYCHLNSCFGQYLYKENKIVLADKYKTKKGWRKFKPEIIEHVFYHELTHCILYYMDHELWDDEDFVSRFSGLLAQTMNYESNKTDRKSGT